MRDQRLGLVLAGALAEVELEGTGLNCGGSPAVTEAMTASGLEVSMWRRFGKTATELPPPGRYDRIAMRLPKGRTNLRAMIHQAAACLSDEGRLWLVGGNDEGIKSADKTLLEVFSEVEKIDSRKHARLLEARGVHAPLLGLDAFVTRVQATVGDRTLDYDTLPGVFSEGRLDAGTTLLLEALTVEKDQAVLDFGCGAGVIGAYLAPLTERVTGLDIDAWAVRCARANAPGTYQVCSGWADVEGRFDHIVSNPPFHLGKEQDFSVIDQLIAGAREKLRRKGALTFVCPVTAPVVKPLKDAFKEVTVIASNRSYKVWQAR